MLYFHYFKSHIYKIWFTSTRQLIQFYINVPKLLSGSIILAQSALRHKLSIFITLPIHYSFHFFSLPFIIIDNVLK